MWPNDTVELVGDGWSVPPDPLGTVLQTQTVGAFTRHPWRIAQLRARATAVWRSAVRRSRGVLVFRLLARGCSVNHPSLSVVSLVEIQPC